MEVKKKIHIKIIWAHFLIFNIKIHVFLKKKSNLYLLKNKRITDWVQDGRTVRPLCKPALCIYWIRKTVSSKSVFIDNIIP